MFAADVTPPVHKTKGNNLVLLEKNEWLYNIDSRLLIGNPLTFTSEFTKLMWASSVNFNRYICTPKLFKRDFIGKYIYITYVPDLLQIPHYITRNDGKKNENISTIDV